VALYKEEVEVLEKKEETNYSVLEIEEERKKKKEEEEKEEKRKKEEEEESK
jgi:hypothetical protein